MKEDENLQLAITKFWETIPSIWSNVRENVRENATKGFKLTLIQFHMLRHIRAGAHSVSELSERQQISRPAISQAIEQLVSKNLVARRQDTQDRRCVQLSLTEEGNKLLDVIFYENRLWMEKQLSAVSSQEIDVLNQALDILKQTLKKPIH
jgi:DNA-binding MarR family transcriptional regulator